ncbi:MAG TPA: SET domain-containing protein [Terriglobales bacterium]|jgi:hypothetical protein|nr:SET domain-containing protein [Terriglobales bacterium]
MLLSHIIAKPSHAHGLGLFATEPIPTGTVIWHPCCRCPVFSRRELSLLSVTQIQQLDEYGYYLEDGSVILPCTLAFLLNHSCDANVLDYGLDFGIAIRDIAAGEEILCDYRTFLSDPGWKVDCRCGSPHCSRTISPALPLPDGLVDLWTVKTLYALQFLHRVHQPLHSSLQASSLAYVDSQKSRFIPNPRQYNIRRHPAGIEATTCF